MTLNRRVFLITSSGMLSANAAPSDQVTLGLIGAGSLGTFLMSTFQSIPLRVCSRPTACPIAYNIARRLACCVRHANVVCVMPIMTGFNS
jgi:hypothetical protein